MCGTRLLGLPRGFSVLNFVNDWCGLRDVLCVKADDEARRAVKLKAELKRRVHLSI